MAEQKKDAVEITAEEKWKKEQENLFKKFVQLNVNDRTETKNGLTYLSWAWAWQEALRICPTATYEIKHFIDKDGVSRCYQYDQNLGYMVFTSVTIDGLTREMWLPVMDNKNNAMKDEVYKVKKGNYETLVQPATMFDINTAIMRCLVKNIAMFGLGLYIYAGEDLPQDEAEKKEEPKMASQPKILTIKAICEKNKVDADAWVKSNGRTWETLTEDEATQMLMTLKKKYGDK